MISGGNATILVSNMDNAVKFYTDVLGFKLQYRSGDEWAQIDAGSGLSLGLHPAKAHTPKPGTLGSISVGLTPTEPLDTVVEILKSRGVVFSGPIVEDGGVRLAFLGDPDGNDLYLWEYRK
ncbi:MAG: VOC family protein [candidate division Zixibacteria bacterium]|nr:VOC family protein [candidate division Zixibacteria bacterium]